MSMFFLEGDIKHAREVVTICITWCWIYNIYPDNIWVKDDGWFCLKHRFIIKGQGIEERDSNGMECRWYNLCDAVDYRENLMPLREKLARIESCFCDAERTRGVAIALNDNPVRRDERNLNRIDLSGYTGV